MPKVLGEMLIFRSLRYFVQPAWLATISRSLPLL
jgi:hypothetical protein